MAEMAVQRTMRGEDGAITVAYIDLTTLKPVTDLTGYAVIQPANVQIEDIPYYQQPAGAQQVATPEEAQEAVEAGTIPPPDEARFGSGGNLDAGEDPTGMNGARRDATNNFGYREKPGLLGLASALPGPMGMVGKVANAAWNENNRAAQAKTREMLGLTPKGTFDTIKGIVKDVGPDVGQVNIGDNKYSVAQGGVTKKGTLGLTPMEARQRSLVTDTPITEGKAPSTPRGQGYTPGPAQATPSQKAPGTLGPDAPGTQTGTKRGIAGSLGGVTPTELGTNPGASFPDDMAKMKDISAPLDISTPGMQVKDVQGSQAQAGRYGGVPSKSVKTGAVTAAPQKSVNIGTPSSKPTQSFSPSATSAPATGRANIEPGKAPSPAGWSGLGMGRQYSPQEKAAMAKTMAGELTPGTLKGIAAKNPTAIKEAAAALGTIDNRVNSAKYAGVANPVSKTLAPSQYNANMTKALPNGTVPADITAKNYEKYGPVIDSFVDDYTKGAVASPTPDATHYANLDVSNPAWGGALGTKIGPHSFGTPDTSFSPDPKGYGYSYGPAAAVGLGSAVGPSPSGTFSPEASAPAAGFSAGYTSDVGKTGVGANLGVGAGANMEARGGFSMDTGVTAEKEGTGANMSERGGFSMSGEKSGGGYGGGYGPSKSTPGGYSGGTSTGSKYGGGSGGGTGSSPSSPGNKSPGGFGGGYSGGSTSSGSKYGGGSGGGTGSSPSSGSTKSGSTSSGSASSQAGGSRNGASTGKGMGGYN